MEFIRRDFIRGIMGLLRRPLERNPRNDRRDEAIKVLRLNSHRLLRGEAVGNVIAIPPKADEATL